MAARLPLKPGSSDAEGDDVTHWQNWAKRYAASYADIMGAVDGYYGNGDAAFTRELQRRLGLPQTGIFDDVTAAKAKYAGKDETVAARRKIWIYTAPGSGANWDVGPSYALGEFCKDVLHLNHQPLSFQKGGYLGLLGGDPTFSYNDVIFDQFKSLEHCLAVNPDIDDPDLELWFSGYSQSADGMEDALVKLFGDGGAYAHLRSRIDGSIEFGNPSRQPGRARIGKNAFTNPPGSGIARKIRPDWLNVITYSITTESPGAPDFYAACDDEIRPLFYEWFVEAETEVPFVVYTAQIIIPAVLNLVAPFLGPLGGLANPLATGILAGASGLPPDLLGTLVSGVAGARKKPNPKLIELLSVQGVLTNLPQLLGLLTKMTGVNTHGEYHLDKAEFGGRSGIRVACEIVADFRR